MRRTAAKSVGRLWFAFVLTVVFVVVEIVTAFVADSLALLFPTPPTWRPTRSALR